MELLKLIKRLEIYEKKGEMNVYEIEKMKNDLISIQERMIRREIDMYAEKFLDEMMKRVEQDYQIYQYAYENKKECALLLNVSIRTLYRKIKDESFNSKEKRLIKEMMNK